MHLDSRLRHVVDEIEGARCTIDVGTDHGKVIITAITEGRTMKGIASDISRESLTKARVLADQLNVELDTRCGDGLSVIACGEADTAVIAGMGGNEIVSILDGYKGHIDKLILVPHRDAKLLREYLASHGYEIVKDYMVKEGIFYYPIIVTRVGNMTLTTREKYFGKGTMDDEIFRDYIAYRRRVLEGIMAKTDKADIRAELDAIGSIER